MIIGIGIDLVQTARIQTILVRWGGRFTDRIFTPNEVAYAIKYKEPHLPFSARFAVKEAVLKALGVGLQRGVNLREIETINDSLGKPVVRLSGVTEKIALEKRVSTIFVSISHENDYAIAQVILTDEH